MTGIVTDIQRFSLNDGPGIRTSVFLKGCNMRCKWCHNPETLSQKRQLHFYPDKCIGCGRCFAVCPNSAQRMDGIHLIDRSRCTVCGKCADECFSGALEISGREADVTQLMSEILQDREYCRSSGGGVTLTGGEVMCQAEFARELLHECAKAGIECAVETNLSFPFEVMRPVFNECTLVMCDFKLFDDSRHKFYTGVGNGVIKENLRLLDSLGKPFIVRTPLIPDATDSDENIRCIADFLSDLKNLQYYELLNFNPLGEGKYESLAMENSFAGARPLTDGRLNELRGIASAFGIDVRVM